MNRRLLLALSLSLIVVFSACSTKREGSVTILQPAEAGPLSAPNHLAATTVEVESSDPHALTALQHQLAPHGVTVQPKRPATSILTVEVEDPNAVRELQYVLAPFGVTIRPER